MSIRRIVVVLSVLIGSLFLSIRPLHAESNPIQLWHITFTNQADLQELARDFDVWEVDHKAQTVLAPLTSEEATALAQTHGMILAEDQSPLSPPPVSTSQTSGIPGYACYRTVDETFATLDQLIVDYPLLVAEADIGDSWNKTQAGDPTGDALRVLVISNQAIPGPKFRFFLMGSIHAREYTTAELALRFAESLLEAYGTDANATWLLDHGELHLLTIANPDGRRIAETGQLWRKNTNTNAACSINNPPSFTYGVDLNRNSSFHWNKCEGFNCSSDNSCRETYRGVAPASEPEVSAIEAYVRSIFPDARGATLEDSAPVTTPGVFISLHSYGRLILFPWGWTTTHAPNAYGLATLARRFGYPLNYTVCQAGGAGCLYQTDGTTDDFSYGDLGIASFTIELGTAFFQSCVYFEETILNAGFAALRYAFAAAPQPYQLAQGPEVLNVVAQPQHINTASSSTTSVTISATADASRIATLSGDNISAITEPIDPIRGAKLTIDALPWHDAPFAYTFNAVDGSFDTTQESISTIVDLACLPNGRHTLYLQAEDDAGDVGVLAATFVTVTNPSPFAATISGVQGEGTVEVMEGMAVTYTVALTNTGIATTTYAVEANHDGANILLPAQPLTLSAAASLDFTVVVTPQNNTAGTNLPTVIVIRSIVDPSQCLQVGVVTKVHGWNYRQRLLIIAKN